MAANLIAFACPLHLRHSFKCSAQCAATPPPPPPCASTRHFSKELFEQFLLATQQSICEQLAVADGSGKQFCKDEFQRENNPSLGYGITRVLEDGNLIEKGAANVSIIHGHLSDLRAKAMSARGREVKVGSEYFAGALSVILHPWSPHVPVFRSDVRYFEVGDMGWFGGGADLTPCYLDEEDACFFHGFLKRICDQYDPSFYHNAKCACDSYFYLPARNEHRGIGGIFFDDLESFEHFDDPMHEGHEGKHVEDRQSHCRKAEVFEFIKELALGFLPSYLPIAQKKRALLYGSIQRQWQLLRRGRYLEFNMLYDRGIRFGLEGGRIESIMVSAPPLIAWKYNVIPEPGSEEARMLEVLCSPRDWA